MHDALEIADGVEAVPNRVCPSTLLKPLELLAESQAGIVTPPAYQFAHRDAYAQRLSHSSTQSRHVWRCHQVNLRCREAYSDPIVPHCLAGDAPLLDCLTNGADSFSIVAANASLKRPANSPLLPSPR